MKALGSIDEHSHQVCYLLQQAIEETLCKTGTWKYALVSLMQGKDVDPFNWIQAVTWWLQESAFLGSRTEYIRWKSLNMLYIYQIYVT